MPRTKLGTPKGPFTCYPSFVYVYWDREGPLSYMWRAPPEELRGPAASTALAKLRRDANWVHFYVSHTWEEAGWPKWLSLCTIMNGPFVHIIGLGVCCYWVFLQCVFRREMDPVGFLHTPWHEWLVADVGEAQHPVLWWCRAWGIVIGVPIFFWGGKCGCASVTAGYSDLCSAHRMNPKAKEKPAEKKARTRKLADEMILHLDGCRVLNFFYADKAFGNLRCVFELARFVGSPCRRFDDTGCDRRWVHYISHRHGLAVSVGYAWCFGFVFLSGVVNNRLPLALVRLFRVAFAVASSAGAAWYCVDICKLRDAVDGQLRSFDFNKATTPDPRDRALVELLVQEWYTARLPPHPTKPALQTIHAGQEEEIEVPATAIPRAVTIPEAKELFQAFVRTKVRRRVMRDLGPHSVPIGYWDLTAFTIAFLYTGCDVVPQLPHMVDEGVLMVRASLAFFGMAFLVLPIVLACHYLACRHAVRAKVEETHGARGLYGLCTAYGLAISVLGWAAWKVPCYLVPPYYLIAIAGVCYPLGIVVVRGFYFEPFAPVNGVGRGHWKPKKRGPPKIRGVYQNQDY